MCRVYFNGTFNKPCLKDAAYEISLYLDYSWFARSRALNEYPHISLCKIKRPLVEPFLYGFDFYEQIYKLCPKDAVGQISEDLEWQFMKRNLLKFTKLYALLLLIGPQKRPAAWFSQTWIPIPYRCILANLVEISSKEKFTDGRTDRRRTENDHHSSLEPSAHVS